MVDVYIVGTRTDEHIKQRTRLNDNYIGHLDLYATVQVAETKVQPPSWWHGGMTSTQAEVMAKMMRRRRG